jgi:hypothetical protein
VTRSLTSESGGSGTDGSSRMFEMLLENSGGFVEPTEPSQTGSTGGGGHWLLEVVHPQVHLGRADGSTTKITVIPWMTRRCGTS